MLDTVRSVETPEGVEIEVRAAGPASRLRAWLIDAALRLGLYWLLASLYNALIPGPASSGVFFLTVFVVEWFYPVVCEVFWQGATPGKRAARLVVLHHDGTPVAWTSSLVRNLLSFADFLPMTFGFGLLAMLTDRDFRRLGDLAAGTVVARRPEAETGTRVPAVPPLRPPVALTLEEQRALLEFAERLGTWSGARACELADLVPALTGTSGVEAVSRLVGMASWVIGVRRESFSRQHEAEWSALDGALTTLETPARYRTPAAGVTSLGIGVQPGDAGRDTLRRFPELFRQVCHQLALVRSRRYGTGLETRLNRLALRGHQQLYSGSGIRLSEALPFLRGGFARRVRAEGRVVALAAALVLLPGLATAGAVLARPELAASAMPVEELETLTHQFAPGGSLSQHDSPAQDFERFGFYIWNNISIAFRTFAGGVLFGAGSVAFLAYNGVFAAALAAHVHQQGFDRGLYAYAVGHSAFELTAIVLAGACGLRLGLALLAPGPLRRGRALLEAARRTVPLLYGVTAMLVVAALLEAFWSSSTDVSPTAKLLAGSGLWTMVLGYFTLAGRHHRP